MTNRERDEMRKVSDLLLEHPQIKAMIDLYGWDKEIAWGGGNSPTFRQVKETLCVNWIPWIKAFLRGEG